MIKLAIVTVDYNNHKDTDDWLASSKNLDTNGLEALWLVVDNGSDESIVKTVFKYPKVEWIETGENLGLQAVLIEGWNMQKSGALILY